MNNPLARYPFTNDHGPPLENCVEYRELLAEVERLRGDVARLNKEADWLVKVLSLFTEECPYRFYLVYEEKITIPPVDGCEWQWPECHECDIAKKYPGKCWREAARKAVEDEND